MPSSSGYRDDELKKEELAKTRRGGDAGENQSKSKRRISG
jgi:hypothetical protein